MSENNEAGPVEVPAVTQMGATFAERAKAREAVDGKQVTADADVVEDKAIGRKKATAKRKS